MAMLPPLLLRDEASAVLLLGRGGKSFREEMLRLYPSLEGRIHATGGQEADQISRHLRSVDLLIQPYPAGVNARRGSILAGLAHGVAVVTTAGWLTEPFWSESGAVALVPDEDPAAMIDMAGLLLSDSSARKRLETAATALYRRQFALRHTIQSLRRERCGDPS